LSTALLAESLLWLVRRWKCCRLLGLGGREEKGRAGIIIVLAAGQGRAAAAAAMGDGETGADAAAERTRATDGNAARSEERRCSAEQQGGAIVAIVE